VSFVLIEAAVLSFLRFFQLFPQPFVLLGNFVMPTSQPATLLHQFAHGFNQAINLFCVRHRIPPHCVTNERNRGSPSPAVQATLFELGTNY
jgi:hypothetical protein